MYSSHTILGQALLTSPVQGGLWEPQAGRQRTVRDAPGHWGRGRLTWSGQEENKGTYLLGNNGADAPGKCPRPSPGTHT